MPNLKQLIQVAKILRELPMDEASRMARAKEMGFDLPVFHGTSTEKITKKAATKDHPISFYDGPSSNLELIKEVIPSTYEKMLHSGLKELKPHDAFHGYGIYTAPKEYMYKASEFATGEGEQIYPLMVRGKKIFNTGIGVPANSVYDAVPSKEESLSRLAKALNRSEDSLRQALFSESKFLNENKLVDLLKQVPNEFEGLTRNSEVVVFDPKNIRSKFARFDPEKADSSNISAGLGAIGVGGLAAQQALQSQQPETEEERWNRTMSVLGRK